MSWPGLSEPGATTLIDCCPDEHFVREFKEFPVRVGLDLVRVYARHVRAQSPTRGEISPDHWSFAG
jgi:hypothetical protein